MDMRLGGAYNYREARINSPRIRLYEYEAG